MVVVFHVAGDIAADVARKERTAAISFLVRFEANVKRVVVVHLETLSDFAFVNEPPEIGERTVFSRIQSEHGVIYRSLKEF